MNWHNRDFLEPDYFNDLSIALKQRQFLDKNATTSPADQVGHWIVDRVDQVLAAYSHLDRLPAIADKAMMVFEQAAEQFPNEISDHFRAQAGISAFKGLFSTRHLDVYSMWARIAQRTHSTWHSDVSWLHKLACILLRDSDFSTKLGEAAECCRQGMSRKDTLARIESHHTTLDSANTSAKSLLMLDLL